MHLYKIKHIAKASFAFAIALTAMSVHTTEAQAQDLIARQAPIDRKMKAVDSVVINKAIINNQVQRQHAAANVNYEQTDLYTTWDTKTVHCYGNQPTPEHYRIDLRGYAMPTPSRVVTSNYGYRASFGRMHKGLDIKVYIGDTISSAFDGKVRIVNYEAKGYGNYVVIRHNNGLETVYGHLSKHLCKVGDVVRAGQPIGLGGNTGRSTGSHLHFETRIVGEAINPALLFDFVHQDVTCDFYDYRRNGNSTASARTQTTPRSGAKPAVTQKPAPAKATSAPAKAAATAPKVETPKTPKENTPSATPKDAATAKVTTRTVSNGKPTAKTAPAKPTTTTKTVTTTKTATTAKAAAPTKDAAPAKDSARSSHATAKATAKAEPAKSQSAKATQKAEPAKNEKAASSRSAAKNQDNAKDDTRHHSTTQGKATAKAVAPVSHASHGHAKKA